MRQAKRTIPLTHAQIKRERHWNTEDDNKDNNSGSGANGGGGIAVLMNANRIDIKEDNTNVIVNIIIMVR